MTPITSAALVLVRIGFLSPALPQHTHPTSSRVTSPHASGIAEGTGCPHNLVTLRPVATAPHHELRDSYEEDAMASASLKNQERIIANEKRILRNQRRLLRILDNEKRILQNLQAMLKNQRKILSNQSRILAK
jgi:hypothetical protein